MTRDIGESAILAELPEWVELLATFLTVPGDVWFVFLLLGVLYWFGDSLPGPLALDRGRAAFAIALALGALSVTTAIKEWLRLPRPPGADTPGAIELVPALLQPLYVTIGGADGFGFPSGHAVTAVVVYGGLALLVDSRRGYITAGAVVPLVAISRVFMGVHYLVDTITGLALGGLYLAVVYRLCGRGDNAGRALMLALLAALIGAIAGGYTFDTMAVLGATLGARIAWGSLGGAVVHEATTRIGAAVATVLGLLFAAGFAALDVLGPEPYVAFLGMMVVISGIIAAPLVGEAVARRL